MCTFGKPITEQCAVSYREGVLKTSKAGVVGNSRPLASLKQPRDGVEISLQAELRRRVALHALYHHKACLRYAPVKTEHMDIVLLSNLTYALSRRLVFCERLGAPSEA